MVAAAMGVPFIASCQPARREALHPRTSHEKAEALLGFKAEIELAEGLSRMACWAKSKGFQPVQRLDNFEITEQMPSVWRSFATSS
jgi:hypothetical protein